MEEATLSSEIFRALGYLLIAFIVFIAYYFGKEGLDTSNSSSAANSNHNANETKKHVLTRLFKGLSTIAVIGALSAYVYLGTSSECDGEDPLRDSCVTTQDYTPSDEARIANFAYMITLLGIPFAFGVSSAYSEASRRELRAKQKAYLKSDE